MEDEDSDSNGAPEIKMFLTVDRFCGRSQNLLMEGTAAVIQSEYETSDLTFPAQPSGCMSHPAKRPEVLSSDRTDLR